MPKASGQVASDVRSGMYLAHPLPAGVLSVAGMISSEERTLLAYLAAHAWNSDTRIVDGGCFLGASTRALIEGLKRGGRVVDRRTPVIHSYDLFVADRFMIDGFLSHTDLQPGDRFEESFLREIETDRDLVVVHPGDLRTHPWTDGPIGILFLDLIWSWDINAFVMENFYANLAADVSWVVHQDYVYAWYPWIPVTMEYFHDHFDFVGYVPLATVVFRCHRPLDDREKRIDLLRDVGPDELRSLMERAVDRFSGESRGILECSQASLFRYLGSVEEAREKLRSVIDRYRDLEAPVRFARGIMAHMDSGAAPRIV